MLQKAGEASRDKMSRDLEDMARIVEKVGDDTYLIVCCTFVPVLIRVYTYNTCCMYVFMLARAHTVYFWPSTDAYHTLCTIHSVPFHTGRDSAKQLYLYAVAAAAGDAAASGAAAGASLLGAAAGGAAAHCAAASARLPALGAGGDGGAGGRRHVRCAARSCALCPCALGCAALL